MIEYRVSLHQPEAHLYQVEMKISTPDPKGQRLTLPAWIPGSYMIRDFARHIVSMEAESDGVPLTVWKTDKQSWQCAPANAPVTLRYRVYAWDLSVRGAHFDTTHAFFNGTSLFLRALGHESDPHHVIIERPDHLPNKSPSPRGRGVGVRARMPEDEGYADFTATWRVATTLPAGSPRDDRGFGHFQAPDYDTLIDHPVEIGNLTEIRYRVADTPHRMAITGRIDCDGERLAKDLEKICAAQVEMFGELPRMPEYLFLATAVGDGYGGLEHKTSSALMCDRDDLPRPGMEGAPDEGYRRFLGLCSHEYLHLWNVKRIRPKAFMEHDLSGEVHTTLLWAFEGITSYYDDLMLLRSGVIDRDAWLELLAHNITRLMRNRGRLTQTLAESSFDAWTKFYKQDENAINAIVSYYNKGALAALCLDLLIRRDSNNQRSLDDLMRALWRGHGKPGIGVTEEDIERLAERVSGVKLGDFFDLALRSTAELPLAELLADFGIGMKLRPANDKDQGGALKEPPKASAEERAKPKPTLGLRLAPGNETRIAAVFNDGPAMAAGLAAGDLLVAIDGLKATQDNLEKRIARRDPGDPIEIHAFRRDELMRFNATLQPAPADTCDLWSIPDPADPIRQRRQAWLGVL